MDSVVFLRYALWIAAPAMQLTLIAAMLRGRTYREFPRFFIYTVAQVSRFATLFVTYHRSEKAYFYLYWTAEAVEALLALAVIHEIFLHLFRPYALLQGLATKLFRGAALGLFGLAIVAAAMTSGSEVYPIIAALFALERGVNLVECGLVVAALVLAHTLVLSWRSYAFGIALGFGVTGAAMVIATSIRWYFGDVADTLYRFVVPGAYNVGVLVWLLYFLAPARHGLIVPACAPPVELGQWNAALAQLLRR
jgi:hypothetical protein